MQIYNLTVPKKYTKNGEEKTIWNTVGKMLKFEATTEKPEGYIIELFMLPDLKISVFEQKSNKVPPQPQKPQETQNLNPQPISEGHPDYVNPDNIPF
jgi:hypothetical protein